jgi:hypothetical protein
MGVIVTRVRVKYGRKALDPELMDGEFSVACFTAKPEKGLTSEKYFHFLVLHIEMEDSSPKEAKKHDKEELLFIALKWMKPGATAAVQLYAEPLHMPRDVTLAQLRDAILEQTAKANETEFHDLVSNQKFQMHFVFKGTILKEEEENDSKTLLELCENASSTNSFTLFVVLSNPPKPPKPPEVRPPARHAAVAEEAAAAQTPAPPPDRRRPTTRSPPPPSLPAPFLEELQQQFPEHDIRDLVSTLLSSPDARAQMERSFDLQLAQLDHVPGGMNLLQSLYTQQQDQEERFLFSNSSNGTSSESHNNTSANGSNDAAIAGATGRAMPNPWGNRNHNHRRVPPPPPRRTLPTRTPPALRSTAILPTRPNPWSNVTDDTEQLYETTTATLVPAPAVTTTIPADNPWRVNEPEAQEQLLVDMGFTNRARNRALLQQHDWDTTVDLLLQEQPPEEEGGAEDDDAAAAVQE